MMRNTPDTMYVRAYTPATHSPCADGAEAFFIRMSRMSKVRASVGALHLHLRHGDHQRRAASAALRLLPDTRSSSRETREDLIARCKKAYDEGRISGEDLSRKLWEGFDSLIEEGCFYNPEEMTAEEIALLKDFAETHDILCRPLDNTYDRKVSCVTRKIAASATCCTNGSTSAGRCASG